MFNMNNKKTKQRVSAVIVIILVLAMIIPTLSYLFY
jgi:succinate dehydrogenase hydrophobic anchor subunit